MVHPRRREFLLASGALGIAGAAPAWGAAALRQASPALSTFDDVFGQTVFRPGSTDYDRLIKVYQARAQTRPALFAHCRSTEDVRCGVLAARETGASLAVRCGGHSYAGHSLGDGGVVLDLSGLRSIALADDGSTVTVGGGALAGMIDAATASRGRATTLGQCPTVGIGGFALGGGVGPLMGRCGLACDNLLSAEVVLADGSVVTASQEHDADLYWAVRGGGGNFGVATSMTFRLHEATEVLGGFLSLRSDNPRDMLSEYAAWCAAAPDDLTLLSMIVPDQEGRPTLSVQLCHLGEAEQAERDVAALIGSAHVVENDVRRLPYAELQTQGPPEIPIMASINRGGFRATMDTAAIDALAMALTDAPSPFMLGFVPVHGAVTRVEQSATAFPLRSRGMAFGLTCVLVDPSQTEAITAWISALNTVLSDEDAGAYVNVMDDEGDAAIRAAYGDNYPRLARLKARYDPDNVFRFNQNIAPAG